MRKYYKKRAYQKVGVTVARGAQQAPRESSPVKLGRRAYFRRLNRVTRRKKKTRRKTSPNVPQHIHQAVPQKKQRVTNDEIQRRIQREIIRQSRLTE